MIQLAICSAYYIYIWSICNGEAHIKHMLIDGDGMHQTILSRKKRNDQLGEFFVMKKYCIK